MVKSYSERERERERERDVNMKITSVADFGPYNLLRNVAHGIQLVPPLIQTLITFFLCRKEQHR